MPETSHLLRAQRALADHIIHGAPPGGEALFCGPANRLQAGLETYQRNARMNAGKALSLAYPVLQQVVGTDFMQALAEDYWLLRPSANGDLNQFGEQLAGFLSDFEPVREMPWLPDLARLEWAVHRAASAANHAPVPFSSLLSYDESRLAAVRFRLQPACELHLSRWPIASMWLQHQPGYPGELDLAGRPGECALVARHGLRVQVYELPPASVRFWQAAQAGKCLREMIADALEFEPAFSVGTCLQEGFGRQLVTRIFEEE